MLIREKPKSILMTSHDIMLLLYPVISSHRDLVSASLKHVYNHLTKVDDVIMKNLIRK